MRSPDKETAPVIPGVRAPGGSRSNQSIAEQKGTTMMTQPTDPSTELVDRHGWHSTWCTLREEDESALHSDNEPYCSTMLNSVSVIPEGDVRKCQAWVSATSPFTHGKFTMAEIADREGRYAGVEIVLETFQGPEFEWDDQRIRFTSDAARSLAAALIRAADIEQGLTR
jgi:hypothetical protein